MDTDESEGAEAAQSASDIDDMAELGPARALAVFLVAGGAVIMCALPAATVLGAARLQLDQLAAVLGSLAAVLVGLKAAVALCVAGRWCSEHTARLPRPHAVEPWLG